MNFIIKYLVTLLLLFVYATTAVAMPNESVKQQLDKADKAYKAGDYATALEEVKRLAEQGNAKAQYNLGVLYDNGQGVKQDYTEAVKWYLMAAKQGMHLLNIILE